MCGVVGVIAPRGLNRDQLDDLAIAIERAQERGTDSMGFYSYPNPSHIPPFRLAQYRTVRTYNEGDLREELRQAFGHVIAIANTRAEPTTEYVVDKRPLDVQPFTVGRWSVVHNGTIANDKELEAEGYLKADQSIVDSAIIPSVLAAQPINSLPMFAARVAQKFTGSYAMLALDQDLGMLYAALNYKPLYMVRDEQGAVWLASQPKYIAHVSGNQPYALDQYTAHRFAATPSYVVQETLSLRPRQHQIAKHSLIVCSGGLDSTVAATAAALDSSESRLLHFVYGCRAQVREMEAVQNIAMHLYGSAEPDVLQFVDVEPLFRTIASTSPLLNQHAAIASGERGAEFAYEWVPARNLIFLSLATAIAENEGFDTIVLGNNLEEAGAYPDNEPEFINRFNHLLPYAVAADKRVNVEMPVGNLMKWQIAKMGLEINAPLGLTWSCYKDGSIQCGQCGPCHMRKLAFKMIGAADPAVVTA